MISINFKLQDEYYYLPGPEEEKLYGIYVGRGSYAGGLSIRSSLSEEWSEKRFNFHMGRYTSLKLFPFRLHRRVLTDSYNLQFQCSYC